MPRQLPVSDEIDGRALSTEERERLKRWIQHDGQKRVAHVLGMHVSTLSRLVAGLRCLRSVIVAARMGLARKPEPEPGREEPVT